MALEHEILRVNRKLPAEYSNVMVPLEIGDGTTLLGTSIQIKYDGHTYQLHHRVSSHQAWVMDMDDGSFSLMLWDE